MIFHAIECVSREEGLAHEVAAETAERAARFMLRFLLPHAMRFYT